MSTADPEEPTWFVKGTIQYVMDDGSSWSEEMIVRNILAPDQSTAAEAALISRKLIDGFTVHWGAGRARPGNAATC
jgi:hypothetical protein